MTDSEARRLIQVGDKIKIVDKWPENGTARQNNAGHMDRYLGGIYTVKIVNNAPNNWYCRIKEDDQTWIWFSGAIEYVRGKQVIPIDLEELI
jgi:hypothetical protein